MRMLRKLLDALTREPLGYSADGRMLGLGLATALEKARQDPTVDVEEYLRRRATDGRQTTPSC